ncbi:ankyrin repeat domain-containing protein [Candidatus Babeliales bacterium]|nr:ankyrin repeat domain-containing protein [Candidatus Babeliales bacterium]
MINRLIVLAFALILAPTACVMPAASSSGQGNYYAHPRAGYPSMPGYPSIGHQNYPLLPGYSSHSIAASSSSSTSNMLVPSKEYDILPDHKLLEMLSYAKRGDVDALDKILYDNLTMDPNQDYWGVRPIDAAIENGHIACVRLFCNYFLINDYYQGSVEPPLFKAIACHQNEIAKMLILEYSAHIDVKNSYGMQPLHYAAMCNNEEMCYFLISCGASLNARDFRGLTPVQVAQEEENFEIMTILNAVNEPEFLGVLKDVENLSIDDLTFLQGFIEGQECQ